MQALDASNQTGSSLFKATTAYRIHILIGGFLSVQETARMLRASRFFRCWRVYNIQKRVVLNSGLLLPSLHWQNIERLVLKEVCAGQVAKLFMEGKVSPIHNSSLRYLEVGFKNCNCAECSCPRKESLPLSSVLGYLPELGSLTLIYPKGCALSFEQGGYLPNLKTLRLVGSSDPSYLRGILASNCFPRMQHLIIEVAAHEGAGQFLEKALANVRAINAVETLHVDFELDTIIDRLPISLAFFAKIQDIRLRGARISSGPYYLIATMPQLMDFSLDPVPSDSTSVLVDLPLSLCQTFQTFNVSDLRTLRSISSWRVEALVNKILDIPVAINSDDEENCKPVMQPSLFTSLSIAAISTRHFIHWM